MQVSTLRPGYLVALKTTVAGGVNYRTNTIQEEVRDEYGALRSAWETQKTVENPEEHDAAIKVRSKCRSVITSVCSETAFGLLCPETKKAELDAAIEDAQDRAREFNRNAVISRITVAAIVGFVAQDDVQAVRSINGEVAELLARIDQGVQALDVSAIRDNANRLREVGSMLSDNASERVQDAIKVARSFARKVVKAAEQGAAEIDKAVLVKLRAARTQFLDLEDAAEFQAPADTHARAIDLSDDDDDAVIPPRTPMSIDLDEDEDPVAVPQRAAPVAELFD